MNQETIDYYDKASKSYSELRYKDTFVGFFQYIFGTRRKVFLELLADIEKDLPQNATILEIGCADGVLFKAIEKKFPSRFSKMIGVDISQGMIDEAKRQNTNSRVSFVLRDNLSIEKFDVIIELGVGVYEYEDEWKFISSRLNSDGYIFYTLTSSKSLYTRFKNKDAYYVKYYKLYKEYERFFSKYFSISNSRVYGLFIPKLWSIPIIARVLQPVFDWIFKPFQNLFHEKFYLLKKRGESSF